MMKGEKKIVDWGYSACHELCNHYNYAQSNLVCLITKFTDVFFPPVEKKKKKKTEPFFNFCCAVFTINNIQQWKRDRENKIFLWSSGAFCTSALPHPDAQAELNLNSYQSLMLFTAMAKAAVTQSRSLRRHDRLQTETTNGVTKVWRTLIKADFVISSEV